MFLLTGDPLTVTLSTPLNCRLVTPKQTLILTPWTERGVGWGGGGITIILNLDVLAPVVQTLDSAIHRINHYPADSVIDFRNTYPLDSDLSGG